MASDLAPAHSSSFSSAVRIAALRARSDAASCKRVDASSATSSSALSLDAASSDRKGSSARDEAFARRLADSAAFLCASHSSLAFPSRLRRPSTSAVSSKSFPLTSALARSALSRAAAAASSS